MPHLAHAPIAEQHFDNVKTNLNLRIVQQPQIIKRSLSQQTAFARIDGSGGARPIFGRKGFDLNEYQAIFIAKDEVHLPAMGAEGSGEKLKTQLLKMVAGGLFPQTSALQMQRRFPVPV